MSHTAPLHADIIGAAIGPVIAFFVGVAGHVLAAREDADMALPPIQKDAC